MALAEIAGIANATYLKERNNVMNVSSQACNLENPYCLLAPPSNGVSSLALIVN